MMPSPANQKFIKIFVIDISHPSQRDTNILAMKMKFKDETSDTRQAIRCVDGSPSYSFIL